MIQVGGECRHPDVKLKHVEPLTAEVFQAFIRLAHLNRQGMQRALAQRGVHHGEAICLRLLTEDDGMSQRDLARALHLSPPRVTSILQRLERNGSVTRRPDVDDQRLMRVHLTDEGRLREMKLRAIMEDYISQTLGALSEEEKREFARLLNVLGDRIANILGGDRAPAR